MANLYPSHHLGAYAASFESNKAAQYRKRMSGSSAVTSAELHLKFDKILRLRVYSTKYWKTECFALTVATLIDKASEIEYVGGTYGANRAPTPFICLLLKLLQINPEMDIVEALLLDTTNKYLRALVALYIRMAFRPVNIYKLLEPVLKDYRKLRKRDTTGWSIICMDEFIEELLTSTFVCDLSLPRIVGRKMLVQSGQLEPYISHLNDPVMHSTWDNLSTVMSRSSKPSETKPSNGDQSGNKRKISDISVDPKEVKGSIRYWNRIRKELGMKPLKPPFPDDNYEGRRKTDGKSKVQRYGSRQSKYRF